MNMRLLFLAQCALAASAAFGQSGGSGGAADPIKIGDVTVTVACGRGFMDGIGFSPPLGTIATRANGERRCAPHLLRFQRFTGAAWRKARSRMLSAASPRSRNPGRTGAIGLHIRWPLSATCHSGPPAFGSTRHGGLRSL
jgi:hypothetical protein